MPVTIDPTVGGVNANSWAAVAEADAYFAARVPLSTPWVDMTDKTALLAMATRVLSAMSVARKTLRFDSNGRPYYYTSRKWTGEIATVTQALAWPRIGMFDRLGRAIAENVNPQELKEAQIELAGQLGLSDRTLDNDVAVQGITSVKAGSVAVTFKENIQAQVLPDAVLNLIPPSWLTDEIISYAINRPIFETV